MKYRHKVTGIVIDVNSTMGGAWEAVESPTAPSSTDQKPKKTTEKAVKKNGSAVRKPE